MYHGVVNVYKPKGFTSFDVVAKMRGIYGQKKIGHTGTLDPDAEGVLVVCLGNATKFCEMLIEKKKTYTCTMLLGVTTDTEDTSGKVLSESSTDTISEDQVKETIESFLGDQMQVPPMYSAIKVNGKKLYEYARAGIEVERKARPVTFYQIDVLSMDLPEVTMKISCSAGTYIRSLCRDVGDKLGCGACMKKLVRDRVSNFYVDKSISLDKLQELKNNDMLMESILPITDMFPDYPHLYIKDDASNKLLHNGNPLKKKNFINQDLIDQSHSLYFVYDNENILCGLYEYQYEHFCFKPKKMLLS